MSSEGRAMIDASELEERGVRRVRITPLRRGDARFLISTNERDGVYVTDVRAVSSGTLVYEYSRTHDDQVSANRFHESVARLIGHGDLPKAVSDSLNLDINCFYADPPESARMLKGEPNLDFSAYPPHLQRRLGTQWADYRALRRMDDLFGFSNGQNCAV